MNENSHGMTRGENQKRRKGKRLNRRRSDEKGRPANGWPETYIAMPALI